MTRCPRLTIVGIALLSIVVSARSLSAQMTDAQTKAAKAAEKANPDLIGSLSKALGSNSEQAAGAAGALFGLAKSKLSSGDFSSLEKAIPGMSSMLHAAPAMDSGGTMAKMTGGLGPVTAAFSKLGLKPEMVAAAMPVVTDYVNKKAGPKLGGLLANVLK
jgi:hypothetical protein